MTRGFDDELIQQIEARIDIVDVIGERIELTRKGNRYWGLCPFHAEKTASFSVSQERQMYYCFGCHQGGNIYSFLKQNDRLEFREAVHYLAQKAGLDITRYQSTRSTAKDNQEAALIEINREAVGFYHDLLKNRIGKAAAAYLDRRGISPAMVDRFKLGYAPDDWRQLEEYLLSKGFPIETIVESGLVKRSRNNDLYIDFFRNRLIFPIYDLSGRAIGFGGRLISGDGPKYLNSQENSLFSKRYHLFGLYQGRDAIRHASEVILVEGYMDCLSLQQYGIENVVATLGTALTREQAKLIKRVTEKVMVMYDGDEAGQRETLKALSVLRDEGMESLVVPIPAGVDPDELVREQGKEEFLKFIQNNKCTVSEFKINSYMNSERSMSLDGKVEILRNVFSDVDRIRSLLAQEKQLNYLAHRLSLPEGDVIREFRVWKKGNNASSSIRNKSLNQISSRNQDKKQADGRMEQQLLARMTADSKLFEKVKSLVGLSFFSDPLIRNLAGVVNEIRSSNGLEDIRSLLEDSIFEDEEMTSLWARISILEEETPLTEFEIDDFLRHQAAGQERLQWQQFKAQMKAVETDGDFLSVLETIVRLGNMTCKGREGGTQ